MKVAIIADIHGNADALRAVLKDIENRGINQIYNLGDSLYGPLYPLETYQLLQNFNIKSINGNCDRLLLQESSNETVRYVQTLLSDKHRTWLSNLPNTLEEDDFFYCHGTPTSDEVYLLEELSPNGATLKETEEILKLVEGITQKLIFCAHTHVPRVVYLPDDRIIINPGSVGLPAYEDELPVPHKMESHSPFANYTIVTKHETGWMIDQLHIPYNQERSIIRSVENGREDWAKALETGRM